MRASFEKHEDFRQKYAREGIAKVSAYTTEIIGLAHRSKVEIGVGCAPRVHCFDSSLRTLSSISRVSCNMASSALRASCRLLESMRTEDKADRKRISRRWSMTSAVSNSEIVCRRVCSMKQL